jgi:hypothetical protein
MKPFYRILLIGAACGCSMPSAAQADACIPAVEKSGGVNLTQPPAFPLTAAQKQRLVQTIEEWHFPWEPEVNLLLIPHPKPKFKNNWVSDPMHPIRWSVEYAVICMDTGDEKYRQRAFDILDIILRYQDTDPESKNYGLWPDFMEIPIPKMQKVDGNTADFIGINLIQIRFIHGDVLPEDLKKRIDAAILHAAHSTMRRDMTPAYTNPAVMSLVVTLVAGEAYGDAEIKAFGMDKLKRILDYTKEQGSFTEYSSPNYTIVALDALQMVKNYILEPEALVMVDELMRMCWEHIAVRFHAPTRQWSGPNSRSYQELLPVATQAKFEAALEGVPPQSPDDEKSRGAFLHRLQMEVPEDLKHYFTELKQPREVVECFEKPDYAWMPQVIGTTWLTPDLSLGTVNRGDMWEQRRNLQAYWGTAEAPAVLRTRFLKNGYDFASVNFFSVQHQQRVLAGLNFSTDGGDKHLHQDPIQGGKFKAKDLRLRFEFGGAATNAAITVPRSLNDAAVVEANGLTFYIQAPLAVFDGKEGRWESGRDDNTAWLDLVLFQGLENQLGGGSASFQGLEKQFFLPEAAPALIGFGLSVTSATDETPAELFRGLQATSAGERLEMNWGGLSFSALAGPGPKIELQASYEGSVNGASRARLEEEAK